MISFVVRSISSDALACPFDHRIKIDSHKRSTWITQSVMFRELWARSNPQGMDQDRVKIKKGRGSGFNVEFFIVF